jgi:hypothetical protein
MTKLDYREVNVVVHSLIGIADALIHNNGCENCHSCESIKKAREQLYGLREDVLKILTKEE